MGKIFEALSSQFVHYRLMRESLDNRLNGFVQRVCPVSRPLRKESRAKAAAKTEH